MNTTLEKFLIDTNSIITPYQTYYSFDFGRAFWDCMDREV